MKKLVVLVTQEGLGRVDPADRQFGVEMFDRFLHAFERPSGRHASAFTPMESSWFAQAHLPCWVSGCFREWECAWLRAGPAWSTFRCWTRLRWETWAG
jgi:hypothetical protein